MKHPAPPRQHGVATVESMPVSPVARAVNAILLHAASERASFVAIDHAAVKLLVDDEWRVDTELEPGIAPFLIRRLGVMIGGSWPKHDQFVAGRFALEAADRRHGFLVRIERDDDTGELCALVELIEPDELATRSFPRTPTTHPFR